MRHDVLEYFSVYGTALSIWVTLLGESASLRPLPGSPGSNDTDGLVAFGHLGLHETEPLVCIFSFRFFYTKKKQKKKHFSAFRKCGWVG